MPAHYEILSLLPMGVSYQMPRKLRSPSNTHLNTIPSNAREFLAAGKTGVVYGIDPERVLKEFHDSDGGEVERQVYQQLGSHPNVAKLLETQSDGSIILERGNSMRKICRASSANEIPIQTKVNWLRHAAEGYQHLHDRNIIHGDVGCSNLIITRDGLVKLIDFEGCSIDGGPAGSCYEWFSYRPSVPRVSRRTDIFAFGCVIYEVFTGRPPHHELEASDDRYRQVEELYTNNHFPDVTNIPFGQLIQSCWDGDFSSMDEVIQELKAFRRRPLSWQAITSDWIRKWFSFFL
ncbi:kinase-like protein [Mytilinidion resinicola]|uniref:Kinase-like protein n=1 Tax=Mytilinidion resinicola TaxID=574789 RepID=A0A6A6Y966_9PEZI|nr:kinase-like protein [Mytilinidion resinicola]KAF2805098.1 kinase-like protein [Mytilinidion resinicola]